MEKKRDTELLAVPKPKNMPRYHFAQMFAYCEKHGKNIEQLTKEEKRMFEIKNQ